MNEQEMIADIITEMRNLAEHRDWNNHTRQSNRERVSDIAGRLEAAWKREKAAIEADALAVGGLVEASRATTENSSAVGNGAKMREALGALSAWVRVVKNNPKDTTAIECAEFVEETIRVALAAPPKNCDVGTVADQARRYRAFCERHKGCDECYIELNGETLDCEFAWAQTPYKKGENNERV